MFAMKRIHLNRFQRMLGLVRLPGMRALWLLNASRPPPRLGMIESTLLPLCHLPTPGIMSAVENSDGS